MSCTFSDYKSGLLFGDYWCIKQDKRVDDDTYRRYCRDYNYGKCPIFKKNESSGCYITTIVCDILGRSDDDCVLNNLRDFRDDVLQKDEQYYDILKCYDTVGPILAMSIYHDFQREEISKYLYDDVLRKISDQIKEGEVDKAVYNYQMMTLFLIAYYGFADRYLELQSDGYGYLENNFDPKSAGHGKMKKLTL